MDRPNLRRFRKDNVLTQSGMAKRLGISLQHYKNIEAGFSDPSYKTMQRFADEFPYQADLAWWTFQKENKPKITKINVIQDPNFIDEIKVETDWGKS